MATNDFFFLKILHLVSWILCLTRYFDESKCDSVNAGSRRILKRSCSHARKSSARLIFLCVMLKYISGYSILVTFSKFCNQNKRKKRIKEKQIRASSEEDWGYKVLCYL